MNQIYLGSNLLSNIGGGVTPLDYEVDCYNWNIAMNKFANQDKDQFMSQYVYGGSKVLRLFGILHGDTTTQVEQQDVFWSCPVIFDIQFSKDNNQVFTEIVVINMVYDSSRYGLYKYNSIELSGPGQIRLNIGGSSTVPSILYSLCYFKIVPILTFTKNITPS